MLLGSARYLQDYLIQISINCLSSFYILSNIYSYNLKYKNINISISSTSKYIYTIISSKYLTPIILIFTIYYLTSTIYHLISTILMLSVKRGSTSSAKPKVYITWLNICFSTVIIYHAGIRKFVGVWELSPRIIDV